jgi:hypothetical protein
LQTGDTLASGRNYSFIGFAAAAFITAIVSLIIIGIVAGSTSVSGNGVVIQQDALNALPINVAGSASVDYNITTISGGNVSVYLINQDQLVPLEQGQTFPSYPLFNCENVNHASKYGNLTSGQYYLVIVNGLSANSTGPVTVDYHMNIGGQTGNMSLIGWIWSAVAFAAALAMAFGIIRLTRGKRTKKTAPRRLKNSRERPKDN